MIVIKCVLCENNDCRRGKDCYGTKDISYTGEDLNVLIASKLMEKGLARLNQVMEYCRIMGYKKIGLAYCVTYKKESKIIHNTLAREFDVISVCCKNGGIDKSVFGVKKKNVNEHDSMCNPKGQAFLLNKCNTDLNIIIGLCIGHDILFTEYSKAPVTTLIVKENHPDLKVN